MNIGIIGAGNIGTALTRNLTARGFDVTIANSRGPETLADLVGETGAKATTVTEAVKGADIIVVTIPMKAVPNLPEGLFADVPDSTPVIDTGNYYPQQRDGKIEEIENGLTESQWTANHLGRPVIKAFNDIYADHIVSAAKPAGDPERRALPIAGNDPAAKATVAALIDTMGFDTVDAGTLEESWRQQPGTPSYGASADVEGMQKLLAEASAERTPDWRA